VSLVSQRWLVGSLASRTDTMIRPRSDSAVREVGTPVFVMAVHTAARLGLVPLHPADSGSRDHPLFLHLTELLADRGITVERFDRRSATPGRDVALADQASDARLAMTRLRDHIDARVGVWGFSQGAWAAALAAADDQATAFLITVSASGVSPACQMRYGTREQLRRGGFATAELDVLRETYERYLRGELDRGAAQAVVDDAATRPWFDLAWVPRDLPDAGSWPDMDFDPREAISRVQCPVLAFWSSADEWVPLERSIARWRPAGPLTTVRLPDATHEPSPGALYERELCQFLDAI
jgi:pimeloyl-ACP methyl ester carboxylesterase